MKRVIWIVLDSFGLGELPDAATFGDTGANTLGDILAVRPNLKIPNLVSLGLGCISGVEGLEKVTHPLGAFGKMAEHSNGKDTITGHWELAGLFTETPFQTFQRFPEDFMKKFEGAIGRETLGNYAASGTEIIKELGDEHKRTGKPIVYTSSDSVFQIAANTEIIPLETLYEYCETARKLLQGDMLVGRVIARPFIVKDGEYIRTSDRRDYAVAPPSPTVLDYISRAGKTVYAVGKIKDIFDGKGVSTSVHTNDNMDGVDQTLAAMKKDFQGLIFTNLVDFDSKYGHRRDPDGYGRCLEEFDSRLPELMEALREEEALILCADHGNAPGFEGWNHTREYVPILAFGKKIRPELDLGIRSSFADAGAAVCELLNVDYYGKGLSFADLILK